MNFQPELVFFNSPPIDVYILSDYDIVGNYYETFYSNSALIS